MTDCFKYFLMMLDNLALRVYNDVFGVELSW